MKNVYHIENGVRKLKGGRVNPTYKTTQVIMPSIFEHFRFQACKPLISCTSPRGTDIPKIDTFRDTSKTMSIKLLQLAQSLFIKMMRRDKEFDNGTIAGLVVCALDGLDIFNGNKIITDNNLIKKGDIITVLEAYWIEKDESGNEVLRLPYGSLKVPITEDSEYILYF